MPSTKNRKLTLTTKGLDTTITVTYEAVFTPFERHLANLRLSFQEYIAVIGIDPPGEYTGDELIVLSHKKLPVTDGNDYQTISRKVSKTVTRASLQEDSGLGDDDEIRCRIRIEAKGLPPGVTPDAFTDEQILVC